MSQDNSNSNGIATPNDTAAGSVPGRRDWPLIGDDVELSYSSTDEPVIDGESITAKPGAVTALVGPNGSGKSTLLKGLANQLEPDAGSVLLDGQDIQTLETKAIARKLGLLSQESTSPNSISVEDLVYHGRYPHRGFFDSVTEEDEAAVERAIDLAGCGHLREREVGSLSGGQKQLAWIAMVLAQDTDVLLLDEPTTFLDLHHQLEVMEIIETLRDESDITIVVVLHDIEQAARLADKMVALKDGEIQARGEPEAVVTEQLLADVFEIEAEVSATPHGPRVNPIRARHDGDEYPSGDESAEPDRSEEIVAE
ncbi:ABC transporter ATP-binding protein [Haloarcula sp. CBA1130]|uniref:ABC transporter ATP-binding protein n=1 Tax=unclassified Haloarcula TaxID=2624677 RepID=UPI0012474ACA|nr:MULTISPECIES: ABC transporter ATP-binding protein [unclassified Haloarcula]KAA9395966.1 ABC transporter ATP-binding protein [Haloarcula sp. CBA1129]KAA9400504.1 ABC transporter ATP-binding protein [Haloarcula sp. CBA1130]